jgi:hypothetical protein
VGAVAARVLGADLAVRRDGDAVTHVETSAILLTTLYAGLAGWGLVVLLERWTARPRRVWTVIAVVVLGVSLLGPLGAVTAEATAVLIGLHVLVAGNLIWGLRRTAGKDERPTRQVPSDPPGRHETHLASGTWTGR